MQLRTANSQPRLTATPTLVPGCGLSAMLYHDTAAGDRWADEAIPEIDSANVVFIPLVHRADRGFDTDVFIMNTARSSDVTVDLIYRPDLETGADARDLTTLTIPAQSSTRAVFPGGIPRALSTLEISGPVGAKLIAAAYTTGPQEMAASHPGISRNGTARSIALPLLFKASGYEHGYTSMVRVMKVFPNGGAAEPTITFRDRDSGERIGPIAAAGRDGRRKVLLEGQGHTWDPAQIPELRDGRVYSAVVESETRSEIAVTVEQVNWRRGTLSAYTGSPIKETVTLRPEPLTDPITGAPIPLHPRGVPGQPGGPAGPAFIDPAGAGGGPSRGAGPGAADASGIPPAAPLPGALPTPVTITKELPRRLTAPLVVKNAGGLNSGIGVQNLSTNAVSVVVTFLDEGGHVLLEHAARDVPAEGSATIYLPVLDLPDGFVGRADIVGSGPIAAVVHTARYR